MVAGCRSSVGRPLAHSTAPMASLLSPNALLALGGDAKPFRRTGASCLAWRLGRAPPPSQPQRAVAEPLSDPAGVCSGNGRRVARQAEPTRFLLSDAAGR